MATIEGQAEHDEALVRMVEASYSAIGTGTADTVVPSPLSLVKLTAATPNTLHTNTTSTTTQSRSQQGQSAQLMTAPSEQPMFHFKDSHQLLDELLLEIIHRAASDPQVDETTHLLSDPQLVPSLDTYRVVCKRWTSLIDSTPTLWAFLSGDSSSPQALSRAIHKSRNALVVISYGAGKMERGQFVDMVAPQMHRCKALWISGEESKGHAPPLQLLLEIPCPNLEELHFSFSPQWTIEMSETIENGRRNETTLPCFNMWALQNNAQKIRVLGFGKLVEWRVGSGFTNLRELKLRESEITVGQLVECLKEVPLLRSLVLDNSRRGKNQDVGRESTVELALLTRIEILNASVSFAHAALSRIVPPSLKQLIISVGEFDLPALQLDDIETYYQSLILSLVEIHNTEPIPIRVSNNFLAVAVADHGTSREFQLSGARFWTNEDRSRCAKSIYDLTQWWGSVSGPSFCLRWGMGPSTDEYGGTMNEEFLNSLMEIVAIVKIQVGRTVYGVPHLYRRLSYATRGGDSEPPRWLLPRLVTLEIEEHDYLDGDMIRMLRDRYIAIATAHGGPGVPLPFSMVKLVRDQESEPDYTGEIRSIVGEEHLSLIIKSNR
ncbi:hypothetical protein FRC01_000183 [Tulasnella sp. 417]|nr:hypothetical protein FRC01_000183 [Tulasnella sp. 417]